VALVADCKPKLALTSNAYHTAKRISGVASSLSFGSSTVSWPKALQWVVVDSILKPPAASAISAETLEATAPPADRDAVAFLQCVFGFPSFLSRRCCALSASSPSSLLTYSLS
jgi:hypothetical protein